MILLERKKIFSICALLVLACGALCVGKKTLASDDSSDETVGISVDQSTFAFDLAPGEEKRISINIANSSSHEQRMSAEVQDFYVGDNNETNFIDGDNEAYGMRSWLKISSDPWLLAPGGSEKINFSVVVPRDAVVGSHYGAVMLRAFPEINVENYQSTIVSGRIGIYVLINVSGEKSGAGKLTKFEAPLVAGKSITFNSEFTNDGTVHYIPHGEISIRNFLTRKTEKLDLEKHFVFPGKKYSFAASWNTRSLFGIYVAQASFTDGDGRPHQSQRVIFGKYSFITMLGLAALAFAIIKAGYVFYRKKKQSK